jgi:hypothetical protein
MLPCRRHKVGRLSADAVSCRVGPRAEVKNSPFYFSAKKTRNVGISMLQGQQMKPVGTKCFKANFNLFNSKHDGKVYYESEIFKENLSSILKIFTIKPSHGKF